METSAADPCWPGSKVWHINLMTAVKLAAMSDFSIRFNNDLFDPTTRALNEILSRRKNVAKMILDGGDDRATEALIESFKRMNEDIRNILGLI